MAATIKLKTRSRNRETDILSGCLDLLRLKGFYPIRVNSGAFTGSHNGKTRFFRFTSEKGVSDIIAVSPDGKFVAIEVKRPGNEPTADQHAFLERVFQNGGLAAWVSSIAELQEKLVEWGY